MWLAILGYDTRVVISRQRLIAEPVIETSSSVARGLFIFFSFSSLMQTTKECGLWASGLVKAHYVIMSCSRHPFSIFFPKITRKLGRVVRGLSVFRIVGNTCLGQKDIEHLTTLQRNYSAKPTNFETPQRNLAGRMASPWRGHRPKACARSHGSRHRQHHPPTCSRLHPARIRS